MDFMLLDSVRVMQLDRRFALNRYGTIRLIKDKFKTKGKARDTLKKYNVVRTSI